MEFVPDISESIDRGVNSLREWMRDGPRTKIGKIFGKGWHDFYYEKDRSAGAHASLEGFLACKHDKISRRLGDSLNEFEQVVFNEYLVPLFCGTKDGWPQEKLDQRDEARCTTIKLAKFAQCCFYSAHPRRSEMAARALERLNGSLGPDGLSAGHAILKPDSGVFHPSRFATAEVLRAKWLWEQNEIEREKLIANVGRLLSPPKEPLRRNLWKIENIPWLRRTLPILSVLYTTCGEHLAQMDAAEPMRKLFDEILSRILKYEYFLMGDTIVETYSFSSGQQQKSRRQMKKKQRTDYVSFECSLMLCQTVFGGIRYRLLPPCLSALVQPLLISSFGDRTSGYCVDIKCLDAVEHQKNRFSYFCTTLRTLADAESVYLLEHVPKPHHVPMYVNPTRFSARNVVPDGKTAFLAMPFEEGSETLKNTKIQLRETCSNKHYTLSRNDDESGPGSEIIQKIWENILKSDFVVAVCIGGNPNVYYEVGLAHAIGRPVFLCGTDEKDFAFDVRSQKCYKFDGSQSGLNELSRHLEKFIEELKQGELP